MRETTTRPAILSGRGHRSLKAIEVPDVFIEPHTFRSYVFDHLYEVLETSPGGL